MQIVLYNSLRAYRNINCHNHCHHCHFPQSLPSLPPATIIAITATSHNHCHHCHQPQSLPRLPPATNPHNDHHHTTTPPHNHTITHNHYSQFTRLYYSNKLTEHSYQYRAVLATLLRYKFMIELPSEIFLKFALHVLIIDSY